MAKINLTKFYMDQIKTVFGLTESEIYNRVKHPISVTIGKTKRKYQIFDNVIAALRDEGELRIGYFNRNGDFRMYCSYPFVYQPEFMIIAGKSFKTDSADKVRIAINYLDVVLSLESLNENV
jgi:hypothetical protein